MIQAMPYTAAQGMLDALNPFGNRVYWKSEILRTIDDDVLETVIDRAAESASPLSQTLIEFYGGAINRIGVSDTAYPLREATYALNAISVWTDPGQDAANVGWARSTFEAMQPYSPGSVYVNFLGVGDGTEDRVKAAYGPNYARLADIKGVYDPNNVFRMNHNILPAR
jgi:hypothetical protein